MKQLLFLVGAFASLGMVPVAAAGTVDFVKDIQPIFQDVCIKCHGPEKQKGSLRLDSKAAALKGGKDGVVITPGDADKSDLYRRISLPAGNDDIMPSKGDALSKTQQNLIRDWINQGAAWPEGAVAKATEEPMAASGGSGLAPYQPTAGELAAVAKLQAAGFMVGPVAANVNWLQANFHNRAKNVTDEIIAPLKDIPGLIDLDLSASKISDSGLQEIAGLTNLIKLHLEQTHLTDAGLAHLKKLSRLEYLNLYGTAVTDQGLAQLKCLSSLKHLYLWQTKVTAEGASEVQRALPQLMISLGCEK